MSDPKVPLPDEPELQIVPVSPPPGSWAETARIMVELGIMGGEEADAWKDQEKEADLPN